MKYISFQKVEAPFTTLEFRGDIEGVEVHNFDGNVVSLIGDDALVEALVASQPKEIACTYISLDTFKSLVKESAQIKLINQNVKNAIALKYDTADEISMLKRDAADEKRVAYEAYVTECKSLGDTQKAAMGYM